MKSHWQYSFLDIKLGNIEKNIKQRNPLFKPLVDTSRDVMSEESCGRPLCRDWMRAKYVALLEKADSSPNPKNGHDRHYNAFLWAPDYTR